MSEPDDICLQQRIEWSKTALEFYKHEINVISQRNSAFLIVQSILVTAVSTFLVNAQNMPYALVFFVGFIAIGGSLFCLFHNRAGRSGALAAGNWRRYMCFLEGKAEKISPLAKFYSYLDKGHGYLDQDHSRLNQENSRCNFNRIKNWFSRVKCERCRADRMPLPHAWIVNPGIFAVGWFIVAVYITFRLLLPTRDPIVINLLLFSDVCPQQVNVAPFTGWVWSAIILFIVISIFTLCICGVILHAVYKWEKTILPNDYIETYRNFPLQ